MNTRRQFLIKAPLGLATVAAACRGEPQAGAPAAGTPATPGAPVAFGTGPDSGPPVDAGTFAAADKLLQLNTTDAERGQMAQAWRRTFGATMERRAGPRVVALGNELAPATVWNPAAAVGFVPPTRDRFVRSSGDPGPLPASDAEIAFSPVTSLSRWIERKQLTSERLTGIYLARIAKYDPQLRCVITVTTERAMQQARAADAEIARGRYRGPLHGIPFGVKDLLDTAGIATTWGAEPFRDRVPTADSVVVRRLQDAGAVLVAKLSLGALALNDIWFGGQTMNPWLLEEGASGSSAGPGSATASALVAFSIGSETGGSIVAPSMRCGVTGLRPTFGRVPRTGAMALCWSLDKLGPMTRTVEDAMLVLQAITGPDGDDVASVASHLDYDAAAPVRGLKVGYFPTWMEAATPVDRAALDLLTQQGMQGVELTWPDLPQASLMPVLFAEAAAAFEEMTLSGRDDQLKVQVPDAWPNLFRMTRYLSAVDLVQGDRLRRRFAVEVAKLFEQVDVLLVPSLRDEALTVTNFTGQPSLTVRTGFVEVREARSDWAPDPANPLPTFDPPRRVPHGVTVIGRLFDEGTVARVGLALERAAGVAKERPSGFDAV
ncbi:MAG: amidase [Gemmatimonadetes bacterium]|nr:amidase [Gemmatimonadota bacterium]